MCPVIRLNCGLQEVGSTIPYHAKSYHTLSYHTKPHYTIAQQLWAAVEVGRAAVTLGRPSVNRAAHTELGLSKTQNTTITEFCFCF